MIGEIEVYLFIVYFDVLALIRVTLRVAKMTSTMDCYSTPGKFADGIVMRHRYIVIWDAETNSCFAYMNVFAGIIR